MISDAGRKSYKGKLLISLPAADSVDKKWQFEAKLTIFALADSSANKVHAEQVVHITLNSDIDPHASMLAPTVDVLSAVSL